MYDGRLAKYCIEFGMSTPGEIAMSKLDPFNMECITGLLYLPTVYHDILAE